MRIEKSKKQTIPISDSKGENSFVVFELRMYNILIALRNQNRSIGVIKLFFFEGHWQTGNTSILVQQSRFDP